MKLLQVTVLISLLYSNVSADVCQTPLLQQGTCKPITQCQVLYDLLQENPSRTVISFLKKSQCGQEGPNPKVCCPEVIPEFGKKTLLPNPDVCGDFPNDKLIGGPGTTIDQFPFNALLKYQGNDSNCGGTLISERYILTAAHCIKNNLTSVRLGEHDLGTNPDCEEVYGYGLYCADNYVEVPVEKTITHEGYNSVNHNNDLALVRLKNKIIFSDYVKPACLRESVNYSRLIWAGWGISPNEISKSSKLRAEVIIDDSGKCAKTLNLTLDDKQFCGYQTKSYKSCVGDNGGAVLGFDLQDHRHFVAGILSVGSCDLNKPLMYTKVDKYVQWIIGKLEA